MRRVPREFRNDQTDPSNQSDLSRKPLTPDEKSRLAKNFKGYDISPDMVRLSLVNRYLHGFTDPHIYEYDTLTSEERWNEFADVILANPPFHVPERRHQAPQAFLHPGQAQRGPDFQTIKVQIHNSAFDLGNAVVSSKPDSLKW